MDIQARREVIEAELLHTLDSAYQLGKEHKGIDLYERVQSFKQRFSSLGVVLAGEGELPKPTKDIHIWRDYTPDMAYRDAQAEMLEAGYKQTYSLIGEK